MFFFSEENFFSSPCEAHEVLLLLYTALLLCLVPSTLIKIFVNLFMQLSTYLIKGINLFYIECDWFLIGCFGNYLILLFGSS